MTTRPGTSTGSGPTPEFMTKEDFGPLADLVTFSMRNGRLGDARSLLVKPSISKEFYWQVITDLPPSHSIRNTHLFIRQALVYIRSCRAIVTPDALVRKLAIVLGTARAVTTELYGITAQDLIPGETAAPFFRATPIAGGGFGVSLVPGLTPAAEEELKAELNLTDEEKQAIAAIHMSSIGLLPLQGYSLVMTGHHYLSEGDNQSKRAFQVVERQFWASATVVSWWTTHEKDMKDAMWHKSTHPVSIHLKKQIAQCEQIPEMLETAGAGSAASRLPAVEPEVRRAESYMTLLSTVAPLFQSYGGDLRFDVLADAIDAVRAYPTLIPGASTVDGTGVAAVEKPVLPESVPDIVVDRSSALRNLKDLCKRNANIAATAYGFYCQLSEQSALTGASGGTDTLKNAFSLKGLRNSHLASFTAGTQYYSDYATARNQARMAGKFNPPKYTIG